MDKKKLQKLIELLFSQPVRASWALIATGTLAALLYLNILPNTFIFDDWQQIVDNPFLRRADGLRQIFTTGVWQFLGPVGVSNFYRPLMHAAFYAAFRPFGLNPAGYHAISIALHAAVSLLVYAVVARISLSRLTAVLAALLFAAHPVHTEAVAWISAYPELLCALFSLLAVWLYLRAEPARGAVRLALRLLTGPVLLLGLLSKEIAVIVPALLAAYELLVRRRARFEVQAAGGGPVRVIQHRAPNPGLWMAYASMGAALAAYIAARLHALGAMFPARSAPVPPWEHAWTAAALFFRYLRVQALPLHLHAFYYLPRNQSPFEPAVILGAVTAAAFVGLGIWLYLRRRPEAFAVPLYLLALAPAFLLPYASVGLLMAERYVYLASAGFCWLLAAGLVALGKRFGPRPVAVLFLALLAAYSVRTVLRNEDWSDEIAFYQRTTADFPGFPRAYLNLGEAWMRRNRLAEALEATQAAARLDANYAEPHINLGLIFSRQGDTESAIRHFQRAALLGRQQGNRFVVSRALADLAVSYRSAGRLDEAVEASRQALAADPDFAGAHNNLGYALLLKGNTDEAIEHLKNAVRLDPTLDVAYSNLGLASAKKHDWEAAAGYLRTAIRLNPNNAETHARLGEVYLGRGNVQRALLELRVALELDPSNQRARAVNPPASGPGEKQ